MPLNSPWDDPPFALTAGCLYVVATPIGHLRDITLRALDVLAAADLVAAEDTRHTGRLLAHFGIETPLVSCHEHNEKERTPQLLLRLLNGETVALVSDAGTPTVSDPGYRLVRQASKAGVPVVAIPGPSAVTAALSVSGLSSSEYLFVGFLGKKASARNARLKALAKEPRTVIFFEAPQRIVSLIEALVAIFSDREAVLCRELTKRHEEVLRGDLSSLAAVLAQRETVKGECTLLVAGAPSHLPEVDLEALREILRAHLKKPEKGLSEVAREIASVYGLSRRTVYTIALSVQKERPDIETEGV